MFGARLPIAAAIAAAAAWSVAPEAATRQMIVQIDGVALSSIMFSRWWSTASWTGPIRRR